PYRTWAYPLVPIVYCLGSLGILVNVLVQSPSRSLWSLGLLALGIPVYAFWSRRSPPDDLA
ncbi:MAG: steT 1, partial [Proteobacteria bacterium]|nr:steT 1 [Pseudomonadota bacterium]